MPPPRETAPTFFATTRWTLVGEAASGGEGAERALGTVFSAYWQPLYRYARRRGASPEDAEDIVQGFCAHLLAGDGLRLADRGRGRFRAFMLGALKNYMANEWRRGHREKRGGFAPHLSLDWGDAECGLEPEAGDGPSPERAFDREWAIALLDKVLDALAREEEGFDRWKPFLSLCSEHLSYAEAAEAFGMSEGAVRVAVHRLRKRYRQRVRDEIASTLEDPVMVDDEMESLFSALSEDFA
jgi:RNA polymerase sigma-70 factor (ECF subfamily)